MRSVTNDRVNRAWASGPVGKTVAMDSSDIVIALVVATALAFDFTNGFHDTANAMATSIATRALPPRPRP
jgi:PiT family inorganic phosphate transporter